VIEFRKITHVGACKIIGIFKLSELLPSDDYMYYFNIFLVISIEKSLTMQGWQNRGPGGTCPLPIQKVRGQCITP